MVEIYTPIHFHINLSADPQRATPGQKLDMKGTYQWHLPDPDCSKSLQQLVSWKLKRLSPRPTKSLFP